MNIGLKINKMNEQLKNLNSYRAYIEIGLHGIAKHKFDCDGYYDLNEDQREACKRTLINWVESK
tara:strand:- start:3457 stop:3648 length:192 start_codon:yes stop_codon:yes gene_type:complete